MKTWKMMNSVPTEKTTILPIAGAGLPAYAAADQAMAATSISHSVEMWKIYGDENAETQRENYIESDWREVTVGWAAKVTRTSRYEGDGEEVTWFFIPGKTRPSEGRGFGLDLRWGDPTENSNPKSEKIHVRNVRIEG